MSVVIADVTYQLSSEFGLLSIVLELCRGAYIDPPRPFGTESTGMVSVWGSSRKNICIWQLSILPFRCFCQQKLRSPECYQILTTEMQAIHLCAKLILGHHEYR